MDIVKPLQDAFGTFLNYLPQLAGALAVLLIGYIIAKIVSFLLTRLLGRVGFDRLMNRAGVSSFLERVGSDLTPSKVFGKLAFWFIFIIAFTMFASALGIPQISGFLNDLLGYIPSIFAALAILFLAALLANFAAALIRGATGNRTLAQAGRWAIIVYAVFAALTQLGIAVQLTGNTLLIVLGGIALAGGIAFGWGGRDLAHDALHRAFAANTDKTRPSPDAARAPENTTEHASGDSRSASAR